MHFHSRLKYGAVGVQNLVLKASSEIRFMDLPFVTTSGAALAALMASLALSLEDSDGFILGVLPFIRLSLQDCFHNRPCVSK